MSHLHQCSYYHDLIALFNEKQTHSERICEPSMLKLKRLNVNELETNNIQWNLSNPTHQDTREMCRIIQDVGKLS